MSSSDHDSEGSESEPQQSPETSMSSPSQQVPNLSVISRISTTGADDISLHKDDNKPTLCVVEQPQSHFRFRYKSESLCGSHGCLLGHNTVTGSRTYPTVELVNYSGHARIKCRLFTSDMTCEHPHQLLDNDHESCYSTEVPEQGSYRVCFSGMAIIHTAKKDVVNALVKKRVERIRNANRTTIKAIKKECKEQAASINLNVVVLRFSAHDPDTDTEICSEFSWPINNMKSVATNPLKICRYSKISGPVTGGDDVFLLVDKVSKKHIRVRMFELDADLKVIWERMANFLPSDVHHQTAIVIRTPAYMGPTKAPKIHVLMELVRDTDGRTSDPVPFMYTDPHWVPTKKRKFDLSSSGPSCSTGSSSQIANVPPTPRMPPTPSVPPSPRMPPTPKVPPTPRVPLTLRVLPSQRVPPSQRVIVRSQYCDRRPPLKSSDNQCAVEVLYTSGQGSSGVLGPRLIGDVVPQFPAVLDPVRTSDQLLQAQITSAQLSQYPGALGSQQTSGVPGTQRISARLSQTPDAFGLQETSYNRIQNGSTPLAASAPLSQNSGVLGPQRSTQTSQTMISVPGSQQSDPQLPRTSVGLGHQQNGAHASISYNSGGHHEIAQGFMEIIPSESVTNDNLYDLLSSSVSNEETQPYPADIEMIITDLTEVISDETLSENVTNEYSVLSVPSVSSYNPELEDRSEATLVSTNDPMLAQGQPHVIDPLAIMQASNLSGSQEELERFQAMYPLVYEDPTLPDLSEYQFDVTDSGIKKPKLDFLGDLQSDGMKPYLRLKTEPRDNRSQHSEVPDILDDNLESDEPPAFKPEDFIRVKKLIKEICEIPSTGNGYSVAMSEKLEQLCDIRMSNGDTFLHMTLSYNRPLRTTFEAIVNVIHSMKMPHLLNLTNDLQQTILHLAVLLDQPQPKLVAFLVAKGCDPMIEDYEGNNVIHNAVMCQSSLGTAILESLLDAIKTYDVACDLDAFNYEKQTALHLAAIYDSESSARLLLKHGASYNARDSEGRTPLHLATYDDYLGVTRALLDSVLPCDVDAVDRAGHTALHIACGSYVRENSFEIIKLLLEEGADPFKQDGSKSAMEIAKRSPEMWGFMHELNRSLRLRNAKVSESEDEFLSADEGDTEDQMTSKLQEMKLESEQE